MERRNLIVASLVVVGIAVVGFLRGMSPPDATFATGVQPWSQAGSTDGQQPSYAELREARPTDGDVARTCADCHEDKLDPAPKGTRTQHPIGLSPPKGAQLEALLAAGGVLEATEAHPDGELTCRSCHRPHDASQDSRLVVSADEGTLCLSCHTQQGAAHSQHPVDVKLSKAARAEILALGGPDSSTLSCLSCHDPHGSTAGSLLRTDGTGSAACQSCHTEQATALGKAGHGGQSCVSCHGTHAAPVQKGKSLKAALPADQACVTCHDDVVGKGFLVGDNPRTHGHPLWTSLSPSSPASDPKAIVGCTSCHAPHGTSPALPTKATVAATCTSCHKAMAAVAGTAHDAALHPVAGRDQTCLSCHDVHAEGGLPARPRDAGLNPASASCLGCHGEGDVGGDPGPAFHTDTLLTTASGLPFTPVGPSPYFNAKGTRTDRKGEITCLTCHDLHTDATDFLRASSEVVPYCGVCHGEDATTRHKRFHDSDYRASVQAP